MSCLFDIACNFSSERFDDDLLEVIERAKLNNVSKFLIISASLSDFPKLHQIYTNYIEDSFFTIGTHPHHANEINKDEIQIMREMIKLHNPSCIGETGLDFFRNHSTYDEQIYAFEEQIKLSIEFDKPLYLHQRDAHKDFISLVRKYKNDIPKAVVHCFTGTHKELEDYLELGFYIGLTGWICDERRNIELRESIRSIPLDKIMVETDSPFLIPRNLEKKPKNNRNEPSFLPHIVNEIATLVGLEKNELTDITYKNTIEFLNK